MPFKLSQVDAFADAPFTGNPAAVCQLPRAADPAWMQSVAREMNLSETAFLHPQDEGFALRWFTPTVEVALCGHATLASAHVLWEDGALAPGRAARFSTKSGVLTASQAGEDGLIELDFPATPAEEVAPPKGLLEALGISAHYVGLTRFDYLVEVASEADVRGLTPDFAALRSLGVRGVMVTARGERDQFDFVSRFFAPGSGIDEDPATGSAHCALGPFWAKRLGRDELRAYQASARGAVIRVRVEGDRVKLGGRAVTVLRGTLEC